MSIAEKYIIIKELGDQKRRKFGRVFLMRKRDSEELFVLKTISVRDHETHIIDRLRHEVKFSFSVPGLPEVVDYFEDEEEILLVLKYKNGKTLDIWWNKQSKKKRVKQLKMFLYGISPILNKLRALNIVHADIKPANILVDDSDEELKIHLIDFGLALDLNSLGERKVLFPLGFGAPELILNRLDCVDHTTDLYALGVTIWRLFTGKLPLTHPNPSIFTNLQLVHPLPNHDNLPKGLFPVLLKMTAKHAFKNSPNHMSYDEVGEGLLEGQSLRYQSIEDVLIDVEKLPEGSWINRVLFGNREQN